MTERRLPFKKVSGYVLFNPVYKKSKKRAKKWLRKLDRQTLKKELKIINDHFNNITPEELEQGLIDCGLRSYR